ASESVIFSLAYTLPPHHTLFPYTTLFRSLAQAYTVTEKQQRHARLTEIKTQTLATLAGGDQPKWTQEAVESALFRLESRIVRQRSEEHTSELQSLRHLVCRLLLEKKKNKN